jgi:hypothetical protein
MTDTGRTIFGRGAEGAQPSVIDPTTYQGDSGPGFVVESNNADTSGSLILWDTAYGINAESTEEAHDDAAFAWSPATDGPFLADGPAMVTLKQAGLYLVEYRITGSWPDAVPNQFQSQLSHPGLSGVSLAQEHALARTGLRSVRTLWLPEGEVSLAMGGWHSDPGSNPLVIGYAFLRLCPMFTLTGIEES